MVSSKATILSAAFLLGSALSAEAVRLNFSRVSLSKHSRVLLARTTRVARAPPSRISRETHLRLEGRQEGEAIQDPDVYTGAITMGGKEYIVILDTSNSDIWLDTAPPKDYEHTKVSVTLDYKLADQILEVEGTVGISDLTFGTYKIDDQAFLNIHDDAGEFYKLMGFNGFFGIGLGNSQIDKAIRAAEGESSTRGRSVVQNIFAADPSLERFIAVDLGRKDDVKDVEGITLSIGEYPEEWSEIQETPAIDLYPENAETWTVLVEELSISEQDIELTSVISGVPASSAVARFSINDPNSLLPSTVFDELYGAVEDSATFTTADGEKRWLIPCLGLEVVEVKISGRSFPVHPLDISEIWEDRPDVLKDHTVCISSFRAFEPSRETGYDFLFGSAFMRNVQAVFGYPTFDDKGKVVEDPYILLQADTEVNKLDAQVPVIRGAQMAELPPELAPAAAVKLLAGESSSSDSTSRHNSSQTAHNRHQATHTSANHESSPTGSDLDNSSRKSGGASNTLAEVHTESNDSGVSKYMPAVIGLLAANLLVGLALIVFAIMNYIKRGASGKKTTHVYVPVKPNLDG